jgi:hypothetical protein
MKIIVPNQPDEWTQYYRLRFIVLRQLCQKPAGNEQAPDDDTAKKVAGKIYYAARTRKYPKLLPP